MQTILIVYLAGLAVCVLIGAVLSLVVFRDLGPALAEGAPRPAAAPLSRLVKISCILAALAGGISAKFYGCDYRYADLVGNTPALTLKVFGQVEGAFRWLLVFLLVLAAVILTAMVARTGRARR